MIPPANMIQDESGGKEDERDQNETPKSPTANASQQETKVGLLCYYSLFTTSRTHCPQLLLIEQGKQTSKNMTIKAESTGISDTQRHSCTLSAF